MTIRHALAEARNAGARALQRRAGITTAGVIAVEELGFAPDDRVRYMASQWWTLRRILPRDEVGPDDVFVDFGCGMGQVLYQAAVRYPFRRVEGVEMSPDLTAIAARNLERNRRKFACRDVRLVTSDVLDYAIPDDVTVAYLFNPFGGAIFASVAERLVRSVEAHPRRLRVIYLNPVEEPVLLGAGFRPVRRRRGFRPGAEWSRSKATVMYELAG